MTWKKTAEGYEAKSNTGVTYAAIRNTRLGNFELYANGVAVREGFGVLLREAKEVAGKLDSNPAYTAVEDAGQ